MNPDIEGSPYMPCTLGMSNISCEIHSYAFYVQKHFPDELNLVYFFQTKR